MNENPIAAAHAADQYEHPSPATEAKQDEPKPAEVPDTKEAHEFRSEWNQDEKEDQAK